ncbi:mitogen activated protein kinase [Rhizoctonia solani AG-1 IA]|uniref:Mitogen activated protein kinase n=1 Tax=Thanatephorus cucumeris (strain AG1-IA) TaxID=983506 RepID=L8WGU0_THACA|nr:mitogen activated protein kinase [Rhizoctonia solani AG-1 IA]
MTGYVSTRYYRAPEIMLTWQKYDVAALVAFLRRCSRASHSSPGRIVRRYMIVSFRPLTSNLDVNQFSIITELLGTPPDDVIQTICSENVSGGEYGRESRLTGCADFAICTKLTNDPVALDLLERMLVFDPRKRITAAEALSHEYVAPYHDPTDEPIASEPFDWSFNDADLPVDTWKVMMYSEILDFHQIVEQDVEPNNPQGALAAPVGQVV